MRSNKFNLALALFILANPVHALERFSSKSCLEANYKNKISHRGPLFGLLTHELVIQKTNCVIKVSHKKYMPREWVIDVCREPVHIKVTTVTGVDVAKKIEDCVKPDQSHGTSDFCAQYFKLMDVIQDDGLIFAEGDRDSLYTSHGKTYCAYLLMQRYLNDSLMLSRYTDVPEIFDKGQHPVEAKPVTPPQPVAPQLPVDTTKSATPAQ